MKVNGDRQMRDLYQVGREEVKKWLEDFFAQEPDLTPDEIDNISDGFTAGAAEFWLEKWPNEDWSAR